MLQSKVGVEVRGTKQRGRCYMCTLDPFPQTQPFDGHTSERRGDGGTALPVRPREDAEVVPETPPAPDAFGAPVDDGCPSDRANQVRARTRHSSSSRLRWNAARCRA
jgi:hypothetical protein